MQTASNLWKETAKHLERSVMELSLLNQKLEKRKAHSHTVKVCDILFFIQKTGLKSFYVSI